MPLCRVRPATGLADRGTGSLGLMYLLAVAGSGVKGMLTVDVGDNSRRGGVSAECCDDCTIERGGRLGGLRVGQLLEVRDVICDRGVRGLTGLYLLGCLLCHCRSNMIHIPTTSKTTTVDKVAEISKKNFHIYILKQKSLATHHRYAYLLQKSTLNYCELNKIFMQ